MDYADPTAKEVIKRLDHMKQARSTYEHNWQDIRDLVRPGAADFNRQVTPGQLRTELMYDGTARQASEDLAGGINSYLTNPVDRWFGLAIDDMAAIEDDIYAQIWLEDTADRIYAEYSHPKSRFSPSIREAYLDVGTFGSCVLNQEWNEKESHLLFRTFSLAGCWLDTNSDGGIDTLYRSMKWDKRQLVQEFGEKNLPDKIQRDDSETNKYEVIHAVYPRQDRNRSYMDSKNMKFKSCWVIVECTQTVREGGYRSFPYHVGRWATVAEEIYGYSPAHACLPDIRVLNRMELTILKAAQKVTDPPIFVPNDGVMLPIKIMPGSINFYENGIEEPFRALDNKANIPIGLGTSDRKREQVRKAFHLDWVEVNRKKERQTAYELQQDEEENIRQMGPILGGLQSDLLAPAITRSYELLRDHKRLLPAPASILPYKLKVVYVSPAARAQKAMKAITIGRFAQDLSVWAQVDPQVVDAVDSDQLVQVLAEAREVPRRVVRTPEAVAQIRQERQMQQALAAVEPASKAILNVAKARETGMAAA